jgi:Trp operon repressor|tara:strand:- start:392 stop:874 length:483 start_codon:yes stop_codon:yes gene_type:complete
MVKTKVRKTPTLDAVRGVKYHIGELLSQIKEGQKWKRKYKKLKKSLKKPVVVPPIYTRRIKPHLEHLDNMFNIFGASPKICKEATDMCHKLQTCDEIMGKHSKSVAAAVLYTCFKPELNKKDMAKRSGVSIPTITKLSKIIKTYDPNVIRSVSVMINNIN